MTKKNKKPQKATAKPNYEYGVNQVLFRFVPGDSWEVVDAYPGDPGKKQIHQSIYMELKKRNVF